MGSLFNVYKAVQRKHGRFQDALFQLLPIFVFTCASGLWVLSPYSILLAESRLVEFAFIICKE